MNRNYNNIKKYTVLGIIIGLVAFFIYDFIFISGSDARSMQGNISDSNKSVCYVELDSKKLKKGEIDTLYSDAAGVIADTAIPVTFSVKANPGSLSKVKLFCNGEDIGIMNDDGKEGDSVADDGIYSLSYEITADKDIDVLNYSAALGKNESNIVSINVYQELSEDKIQAVYNADDELAELEGKYKVNGYVPDNKKEQVIDEMYSSISDIAKKEGVGISELTKTEYGISVTYDNGIHYVKTLASPDSENDPDSSVEEEKIYVSVKRMEPYASGEDSLKTFDEEARLIGDTFEGVSYTDIYENEDVTFEHIEEVFQPNSFIIWHGHGGFDGKNSFIVTGEKDTIGNELKHTIDLITQRMIVTEDKRIAVTYRYFDHYLKDLSDSFVYLGGCHTGQDKYLMSVMMWKNAEVVVGFTDEVYSRYDCNIMNEMTKNLCMKSNVTSYYNTIDEAIEAAVRKYGVCDDEHKKSPAFLKYMGNKEYRITDNIPKEYTPIIGKNKGNNGGKDSIDKRLQDARKAIEGKIDELIKAINEGIINILNNMLIRFVRFLDEFLMETCGGCY